MNLVINIPNDKFNLLENEYKLYLTKANQNTLFVAKKKDITISLYKTGKLVIQGLNDLDLELEKKAILEKVFDSKEEYILGFDETGRSELIGPMVITGLFGKNKDLAIIRDSKKTDDLNKAKMRVDSGALGYVTFVLNPNFIDLLRSNEKTLNDIEEKFIVNAKRLFEDLDLEFKSIVDGKALNSKDIKVEYKVKADDLIPVVSAASITSKTIRDFSQNKDTRKTWNIKSKQ
jgi:ribonuclease HII